MYGLLKNTNIGILIPKNGTKMSQRHVSLVEKMVRKGKFQFHTAFRMSTLNPVICSFLPLKVDIFSRTSPKSVTLFQSCFVSSDLDIQGLRLV